MSALGLVVPVNVVAFCVGEVDAVSGTNGMAGAMTDYKDAGGTQDATLGINVTRGFMEAPLKQMEQGIHLHWALPDALTQATVDDNGLQFRAVPNRWLITRILLDGSEASPRSWIVESDALIETAEEEQYPVTLPVRAVDSDAQDFRWLGRYSDFTPEWVSPASQMTAMTGAELSAASTGVVSFASYYPNSRSVFGFCDHLDDVASYPANLTYVVTGWFDDSKNDPLNAGMDQAALQETLKWTFEGNDATPTFSLFSGFVQGLSWDPATRYVLPGAAIQAEAAVANTPSEVLSAYFRFKLEPDQPFFEQMLNAFQLDLLKRFSQPESDQDAQLFEALHQGEFAELNSGTIFTVTPHFAGSGANQGRIPLPIALADALNELNVIQQETNFHSSLVENFRLQMFFDWYRIFLADGECQTTAYLVAMHYCQSWDALEQAQQSLEQQRDAQRTLVESMLGTTFHLKIVPDSRYWQASEPTLLLSAPELAYPDRYGSDASFLQEELLLCRLTTQIVSSVSIGSVTVAADQFSSVELPTPNHLPDSDAGSALLQEACILNTEIAGSLTGVTVATLNDALSDLLNGEQQPLYSNVTGVAPSPVAMEIWNDNPWLPIFLQWSLSYLPIQPTEEGDNLVDYDPLFFTANYSIDRDQGGFIEYAPGDGPGSLPVNPATDPYPQFYSGYSLLSPSSANHFAEQLRNYLNDNTDSTLKAILDQLESGSYVVQPFSGFANALLMRAQSLQLRAYVPADNPFAPLTELAAPIMNGHEHLGPIFNSFFNPIRAGYFRMPQLVAVDAWGQKRTIEFDVLYCADQMTAYADHQPVPSTAYLPPRLAQPARLLFKWIAADGSNLVELNMHPASSPVCGWMLRNHLNGGVFLYNQQGKALGFLNLNGDASQVVWQGAPGNNDDIDKPIETALAGENPQLAGLAISLKNGDPSYFADFCAALDSMRATINPRDLHTNSTLAVLVGNPIAIAQVSLQLELEGMPVTSLSWTCFKEQDGECDYTETDAAITGVEFPVILGDGNQLDDGLIGYFLQSEMAYDWSAFYSEAAQSDASQGVVRPTQSTLTLMPTPPLDSAADPTSAPVAYRTALLLLDPRGQVHATTGILPTAALAIPPDLVNDALSKLEMSFLVAPVLKGNSQLVLPYPTENGYTASWVTQKKNNEEIIGWITNADIATPAGIAVWQYSPQSLVEGWLRYSPSLLSFDLLNAAGQPIVAAGEPNSLSLLLTNHKQTTIQFNPGQNIPEGEINSGSVFYMHFDLLVAAAEVANMVFAAPDWQFAVITDATYGTYWSATPTSAVSLNDNESISITVSGLQAAPAISQAQIDFTYYNVDGLNDGAYNELVSVSASAYAARSLNS